jgi:hypothetical protein
VRWNPEAENREKSGVVVSVSGCAVQWLGFAGGGGRALNMSEESASQSLK